MGLRVTSIKIDPYLNTDAGTMSPFEHGEVFVLDDGGEADLDLGNYERFLDVSLGKEHNITTGKVYSHVIERERKGDYLGKTVQVVPHITDAIQEWIERVAVSASGPKSMPDIIPDADIDQSSGASDVDCDVDVCLVEVGGTVGDIESMVFLEALRQFQFRVGPDNMCLCHVSLVPVLGSVGEQKTKPTQHGVKELRSLGLSPDVIVCRSATELESSTKSKLALFCHVPSENVVSVHDVSNIYHVPDLLVQQDLHSILIKKLKLPVKTKVPQMEKWIAMAHSVDNNEHTVRIALVGKYTGLQDAYLSVIKALKHACIDASKGLEILWVEAVSLEPVQKIKNEAKYNEAWETMKSCDGVVVPGGFGDRGVEGKILAAKWCRENKKPYLGICLGMQAAVIEYATNVLKWEGANSEEFDKNTPHPVIQRLNMSLSNPCLYHCCWVCVPFPPAA
jgi:CTP synthase